MNNGITIPNLIKFYSTFKPCDNHFEAFDIEDEPITMKSDIHWNDINKLPTYRFQIADLDAFYFSLKVLISVLRHQSNSDSNMDYISELLKLFFNINICHKHDICFHDFTDGDRDILIGILAPHILNKNNPDEDEKDQEHSNKDRINTQNSDGNHNLQYDNYKDWLSFADLENQSFLELIDLEWFSNNNHLYHKKDESFINTETKDSRSLKEIIDKEPFFPYFKEDYNVLFGTSNYFVFIRWLYTMYERMRFALKIIRDQVDHDYKEKNHEVMYYFKNYMRSKERLKESRKSHSKNISDNSGLNKVDEDIEYDENKIKSWVVNHKLSVLIGITISRFKSKIDSATYEDLIRTFLGINSFVFVMYDKLIHTTIKSFHTLLHDEYSKSRSFRLFQKYSTLHDRQREKLYLEDYKINLNEMNLSGSFTARLLYSPISRILCINFFHVESPFTNSSLVNQLNEYKTNYTSKASCRKLYSGDLKLPSSNVFLKRNLKCIDESSLYMSQSLTNSFANSSLQIRYQTNTTETFTRNK